MSHLNIYMNLLLLRVQNYLYHIIQTFLFAFFILFLTLSLRH
jgi:hypothetical protein